MVVLTGGVSLDTPSKYKRRKLSPIRDFPEGCGISKPSEKYPVLVGSTESLKADTLNSQEALPIETEKALNEGEAVKAMEASKPVVMENMMVLDQKELVRPSKTLEPASTSSSKNMNQMELLESKNYSNGFECNLVVIQLEAVDQPQTSIPALSMHKYYPPPRRTSVSRDFPSDCCMRVATSRDSPGCCTRIAASRDSPGCCTRIAASRHFPPGCGGKALELSKEERLKLIDSFKNQSSENQKARGDNKELELMVLSDNGKTENVQDGDAFKSKLEGDLIKESASSEDLTSGIKSFSGENRQVEKVVEDDAEKISWSVRDESISKTIRKKDAIKGSMDDAQVKSGQDVLKAMAGRDQVQSALHSKLKEVKEENDSVWSASASNLVRSKTKFPLVSKNVKAEPTHSEKEFEELSKDNSLKRKLPGNSGDGRYFSSQPQGDNSLKRKLPGNYGDGSYFSSQPQGEESKGLGPYCNREIVQALMAAPYCPWRQEEEVSKSPPPRGLFGGKKKKNGTHVNSEFISMKKDGSQSLGVKSTKRKVPISVRDAYHNIDNQLVLSDEYDSPGDEDDGNLALVPRSPANCSSLIPFDFHAIVDKHDTEAVITRNKVRESLRLFQAISRKLLRDDEAKPKEKYNGRRIDIISADILKENSRWVNTGKQILGTVPGVEVGDEFHYRVELAIIGLHRQYQGGIDYLRLGQRTLATSIVFTGRYDDIDCSESSDILVYSGQGGNPKIQKSKRSKDQILERGNLALKNSRDESSPVRVIRGYKQTKADGRGKIVTTYTYDGLYLVENFWQEKGHYGNNVFKFQLRRIQGQPQLALKEVNKSKQLRVRDGLCVVDISQGKEKMPICAVNTIDDEKPPPFKYMTSMIYPSWYRPTLPKGCQCTNCSDFVECLCADKNGGEIPFNYDGDIVFAKPLVYECGPSCKCPPSCHNRVSQHGIKFQLEIFKTESTGWGVRSLTSIPSGSFVCEYTGELLEDKEAEQRTGSDEYLFDIGKNYNDHALWEGLSNLMPPDLQSSISCDTVEDGGFSIDALKYGNVGRFINHSCSPNLYAQNVLYDHDDKRIPHVMLFAAENIPPLQELTYHYNYKIGQVLDSSGNIKKKDCCCGSDECSGRLY